MNRTFARLLAAVLISAPLALGNAAPDREEARLAMLRRIEAIVPDMPMAGMTPADVLPVGPALPRGAVQQAASRETVDERFIEQSRKKGIWILREAAENSREQWPSLFRKTAEILDKTPIKRPAPNEEFEDCRKKPGMYAYVTTLWPFGVNTIYLCGSVVRRPDVNRSMLAQLFIHEAAHLLPGYINDECATTTVEINAMKWSGEGLAFENAFMERCGLR